MAPILLSAHSSAFLSMPLEIRQHIYRFCIPQNLSLDCSGDMYDQSRPRGWIEPLWRFSLADRYDPGVARLSLEDDDSPGVTRLSLKEDDSPQCEWVSAGTDEENSEKEDDYLPSALPGLLLVCRQITDEVAPMLYGGNTFKVIVHGNGESKLAAAFSPGTREKMRKMLLVLRPMGISYRPDFRMNPRIWDGVLGGLSILGIIAEQPKPPTPYEWERAKPEDVLKEWAAWLSPILEYLDQALPQTAKVVVDVNEEDITVQMVEKLMPGRCLFQRLRTADFIFERGEFSQESGYWDDDGPTSCRDIINDCDYDYYYSD